MDDAPFTQARAGAPPAELSANRSMS
jgi:hypothetical protein